MFEEFKKFIMRGNVMDLAIGIIIGTAFTAIVTSLVNDIIMPPIGFVLGGVDFSDIALILQQAEGDSPAVTIGIGLFINAVINFLIIAAVVFLMVRSLNRLMEAGKKEEEEAPAEPPAPTTDELMLEELRALRQLMEKQDAS